MQCTCNYNSFIQIINFHGLFRNALRCRKLVPAEYWCPYGNSLLPCQIFSYSNNLHRVLHKFLSPLAHWGKWQVRLKNLMKNTCPNVIFTSCPKKIYELFFVLKVVCPQYTFSLPDSGNWYLLVFQNACPNLTFTCPGQSGKCFNM